MDNAILLHYSTSEVALEAREIRRTDPNIRIDNNSTDDELHFGIAGGTWDFEEDGEGCDERDAIHTASHRQSPVTELERFDLGTSDVDGYDGEDGDDGDADADETEEASQPDDGSTQNVQDSGHSRCY